MMQNITTSRLGANHICAAGYRVRCSLVAACLVCFAVPASAAAASAATASETGEAPAAAEDEQATVPVADKAIPTQEEAVVAKVGEPTIRHIGPVATITEVSSGLPFPARVDTGATTCSIHYEAIEIKDPSEKPLDNVGKSVRILIQNRDGGKEWVSTKIVDYVTVRTSTDDDERYKVRLKLRWQDVEKKVLVTLNDRQKMQYPLLLGRNFLRGDFLVDVDLDGE